MLLTVDQSLSSGLWPALKGPITQIVVPDAPFASGAYGSVYACQSIDGQPLSQPLAVKLLHEDEAGMADAGYSTIRKLQAQIIEYEQLHQTRNWPSLASLPLLKALPLLSFEGQRDRTNEQVRGYFAALLPMPPFGELNDLFDHEDLDERKRRLTAFYTLSQNQRLLLGVDLLRGFQALARLSFIHADLNAHNLLVSAQPPAMCLLDYDSGAVTAATADEPQTFGHADDWLAPEVMQQLIQPGTTRVKVNLNTDTWAVGIGLHYLLFPLHPLFFLRSLGLNDVREYLGKFTWPNIDPASPLFNPATTSHYQAYLRQLATLPPNLLGLFATAINKGALNTNQRPAYSRWLTAFDQLLAVEAVINRFDASTSLVPDLTPIRLSWDVAGAASLTLSGVGDVTGHTEALVSVTADTVFTLEATSFGGQKVSQPLPVQVDQRLPDISLFVPSHPAVLAGAAVELRWRAARAARLTLRIDNGAAQALPDGATSFAHTPTASHTRYELRAETVFGQATTAHTDVQVYPRPVLTNFRPDHAQTRPDQPTELRWQAQHYKELTLHFDGRTVDVTNAPAHPVRLRRSTEFKLVALALDGRTKTSQKTQVEVVPPVEIKKFGADRTFVMPTVVVRLAWKVNNATRLVLESDGPDQIVTGQTGCDVHPSHSTTYTLVAENDLFKNVRSEPLRVEVQSLPRLNGLQLPPAPRLALSPPPRLGSWQPHDPTQARRQLFENQVLPPPPPGPTLHPVGSLYARLRSALSAQVGRLFATPADDQPPAT